MNLRDSAFTEELLMQMPKAELHIHIEGSLEPEMMFEIAARNGVRLRYGFVEEVREAYDFADLQSFLDLYYEGTRVLLHERDYYDLTFAYLAEVRLLGVAGRHEGYRRFTRTWTRRTGVTLQWIINSSTG